MALSKGVLVLSGVRIDFFYQYCFLGEGETHKFIVLAKRAAYFAACSLQYFAIVGSFLFG